jgi:hypothetical protein
MGSNAAIVYKPSLLFMILYPGDNVQSVRHGTGSIEHVRNLKECGVFSTQELRGIHRENAMRFLPHRKG